LVGRRLGRRLRDRRRPHRLRLAIGVAHQNGDHLSHGLVAETRRREEALSALLGAEDDRGRLRPRPLERLLDLGARRVRELGGVVARLLEQPVAARLGLAELLVALALRVGEQLARLVASRVHDLGALALAVAAIALDLGVTARKVLLALANVLLGASDLHRRRALRVLLDHVGELGGLTDEVEGVHAHGVPAGLHLDRGARGLEHAELSLQLDDVTAEGLESVADAGLVVALVDDR
jgi:hypothetical protein